MHDSLASLTFFEYFIRQAVGNIGELPFKETGCLIKKGLGDFFIRKRPFCDFIFFMKKRSEKNVALKEFPYGLGERFSK